MFLVKNVVFVQIMNFGHFKGGGGIFDFKVWA